MWNVILTDDHGMENGIHDCTVYHRGTGEFSKLEQDINFV